MKFKKLKTAERRKIHQAMHKLLHSMLREKKQLSFLQFLTAVFEANTNEDPSYIFVLGAEVDSVWFEEEEFQEELPIELLNIPVLKRKGRVIN